MTGIESATTARYSFSTCVTSQKEQSLSNGTDARHDESKPSYVPSYISAAGSVSSTPNYKLHIPSSRRRQVPRYSADVKRKPQLGNIQPTIRQLPKVNVRNAVAAMEAKLSNIDQPKPVTKPRDVTSNDVSVRGVTTRNVNAMDRPITRKGRHRRSMSDPNLHKTFSQVKQLWDAKAQSEQRVCGENSRTASVSSVSSGGSDVSKRSSQTHHGSYDEISESAKKNRQSSSSSKSSKSRNNSTSTKPFVTSPRSFVTSPRQAGKSPKSTSFFSDSKQALKSVGGLVTSPKKTDSSKKRKNRANNVSVTTSESSVKSPRPSITSPKSSVASPKHSLTSSSVPSISVHTTTDSGKEVKPTLPKDHRRSTSSITSLSTSSHKDMTSSSKSVSERAMAFGGTGKVYAAKPGRPRSTPPSPPFQRRVLTSESSTSQSADATENSIVTDNTYEEIDCSSTSKDDLVAKLRQTACSQADEDKIIVNSLEKKANSARERRMKKQGSFDSSEEDTSERRDSFLRRNSSASSRKTSITGKQSPLAIVHTEATIFGGSPDGSSYDSEDDVTKLVRRRASSLHRLFEDKLKFTTSSTPGSPASTSRKNSLNTGNPLPRPNNLPLDRQRSKTELDRITNLVPDKGRSASLGKLTPCDDAPHPQHTPPLPPRPLSNDSSSSTRSNLIEEYEKIAQEVTLDDVTPEPSKARDSGIANCGDSLAVPTGNSERDSWSDFDNSDDGDEESVDSTDKVVNGPVARTPSPAPKKETTETKLHNIAKELLSTEESYVRVLHLIDQVFHKKVREEATQKNIMPETAVNSIFSHVPAIYQFHNTFLLPQLRERLANWEADPRISDIMCRAAPFLKMYSLYVQNFDDAMNTIKTWSQKSHGFSAIIKSIQKLPECNFLTLQHHMLSPVQRIPRYQMLLQDYVRRMPQDATDRPETENALKLITVAATHSNETMKKMEKFHKLVNVFNNLAEVNFDIVDVSRELLKEGKIVKISARNGEKYERYLYLFSDMLLCCTPLGRLQGKSYKVTAKMDLDGMKVTEVRNPTSPFAFCVEGRQKSTEFSASAQEDKDGWVSAIQDAIQQAIERKKTFELDRSVSNNSSTKDEPITSPLSPNAVMTSHPFIDIEDADLGTRAPRWIKDNEVTMCMCCSKRFNNLLRRRHHCRACGRVVCSECSEHKFTLQYDPSKALRVCSTCFNVLTGREQLDSTDGEKKGVLEVEADAVSGNSVLSNYLYFTENEKKKTWTKTWCVIPNDELCLYFYGALQDVRAQMTMPLPGYEVTQFQCSEHKHCFRLVQARKVHLFATDNKEVADRWIYAIKQASIGEDLDRDDVFRLGKSPQTLKHNQPFENGDGDNSSSSGAEVE